MRVRFNLGKKYYKKWQVTDGKEKVYYNPEEVMLVLRNCKLHNNKRVANKIYNGSNKTVCSWIECESVEVLEAKELKGSFIIYNPRIKPYWFNERGEDIDNKTFPLLCTVLRSVIQTA